MNVQTTGLIAIIGFYALFFAVGVYASRRGRTDGTSSTSFLLAGRQLPLLLGVLTMTATWVGGGYINGTAEVVYDSQQGLIWAQAPWGYALSLILGGLFFAGRMRKHGFTTLIDLFEQRYGKRVAAVLCIPALLGEIFWSAAILVALGSTVGLMLGFDLATSIIVSALVAVTYTMLGGLWSVAYTDALQMFCILGGLCLAIPFALEHAGTLETVVAEYRHRFAGAASLAPPASAFSGNDPWGWRWSDAALLLILGGIPWQVYFQRVLACRDAKTARRLSVLAGVGCILMALPAVLIGVIGATADWESVAGIPAPDPEKVLPSVLRYLTPPLVAAIGLGAVAAAVMSSIDSSMLSASSMLAWNVYRPLVRPDATDRETRRVIQVGVLLMGVAATCLALQVQSVYALWFLCADLVYVILFPQLLMGLYFRRANKIGAIAGIVVALSIRTGSGEPTLAIPSAIPYPLTDPLGGETYFPFRTVAMLAGLCTIWLVSYATAAWSPPQTLPKQDPTPLSDPR